MTGTECFRAALNILSETPDSGMYYEQFALGALNQLLANSLREMNAERASDGKDVLLVPPRMTALTEELPAGAALCLYAGLREEYADSSDACCLATRDIRLARRILRDVCERGRTMQSVITQYTSTVKPMHEEFVEPSKKYADVIIPEGGFNSVAVAMLIQNIRSLIQSSK